MSDKPEDVTQEKSNTAYWLIVVEDSVEVAPQCIECANEETLKTAIEQHVLQAKTPLHVFVFKGIRLQVSMPEPVCIIKADDHQLTIGGGQAKYDTGGRILPLKSADAT